MSAKVRKANIRKEKALMMGKLARMILFLYVLSLLRPAVPMVSDVIAHTFYEQEHLMQVHEVHGQFHMHTELGRALDQHDQNKSTQVTYDTIEYIHTAQLAMIAPAIRFVATSYISISDILPQTDGTIDIPPPRGISGHCFC